MAGKARRGRGQKRRKRPERHDGIPTGAECREFCRAADEWLAARGVVFVDDFKFGGHDDGADQE